MNTFDDINQKIYIVIFFLAALLLLWIFVRNKFSDKIQIGSNSRLSHVESRKLAHSAVVSLFEIDQKTVLIMQGKHGVTALDITDTAKSEGSDHAVL